MKSLFYWLSVFILLIAGVVTGLTAQSTTDFCLAIPEGSFSAGDEIVVDVVVGGFTNIQGAQFSLSYDQNELRFSEQRSEYNLLVNPGEEGLRALLFLGAEPPLTLADGSTFTQLVFIAQTDTDSPNLALSHSPINIEVVTVDGTSNDITSCGVPFPAPRAGGTVTFCSPVREEPAAAGASVFTFLQLDGFQDVTSFSVIMSISPGFINYDGVSGPAELDGMTITTLEPGIARIDWSSPDPNVGVSFPDGSQPIQINMTALMDLSLISLDVRDEPGDISVTFVGNQVGSASACGAPVNPGDGPLDICLYYPTEPKAAGDVFFVDVFVSHYRQIQQISLPIAFDTERFAFTGNLVVDPPGESLLSYTFVELNEGLELIAVNWPGPLDIPDGFLFARLEFETTATTDTVSFDLDEELGNLYALRSFEANVSQPMNYCGVPLQPTRLVNIVAEIFRDEGNCSGIPTGEPLKGWGLEVVAETGDIILLLESDEEGRFGANLVPGTYELRWREPGTSGLWGLCETSTFITVEEGGLTQRITATTSVLEECADTYANLSSGNLRPCFENNTFYLDYGNLGTRVAEDAFLDLQIDEAYTIFTSSEAYTEVEAGIYRFLLGDLEPNTRGTIFLTGQLDCEFPVGATVCAEAQIVPNAKECTPEGTFFRGAEFEASASCQGDSILFRIRNTGSGPSGPVQLTVIEDIVIYMKSDFELDAEDLLEITVPSNGATYRLEVTRPSGAPYLSQALAIEEACGSGPGGTISLGFVDDFSLLDGDPWIDRYCLETTAAYDPNDKLASPNGIGNEKIIAPNVGLDYKIRFQNTGTDTAFTVIIRDTLDLEVYDLRTFRTGIASHPFTFSMAGNIAEWRFDNILLPDSTTNEPASNGFLHFKVDQLADLADGTIIANKAGIFFDFNPPIITPLSKLVVSRKAILTSVAQPRLNLPVDIFPSPFNEHLVVDLHTTGEEYQFELFDVLGRSHLKAILRSGRNQINTTDFPRGIFIYRLTDRRGGSQSGTITKR